MIEPKDGARPTSEVQGKPSKPGVWEKRERYWRFTVWCVSKPKPTRVVGQEYEGKSLRKEVRSKEQAAVSLSREGRFPDASSSDRRRTACASRVCVFPLYTVQVSQ